MTGERVVGVDVGGTGLRAAVVEPSGTLGATERRALEDRAVEAVVQGIVELVTDLGPAEAVGVGMPGFVDDTTVIASPNFPEWDQVDLAAALSRHLAVPIAVVNDANAAALGAFSLQEDNADLLLLTLGTGVGGGVISDGRLLRGQRGIGGELGHIVVGGERACGCGGQGCLETWCGTVGLVARATTAGLRVADGEELLRRADEGSDLARAVLGEAGHALGIGLVTLVNLFNPRRVRITGGLTGARRYLGAAEGVLKERAIPAALEGLEVIWDQRADDYAIRGAAEAARRTLG